MHFYSNVMYSPTETEKEVQKNINGLCKILPLYIETWKSLLDSCTKPVHGLFVLAEQLRCVENTNLDYMDEFERTQSNLQFSVAVLIEEDLCTLKMLVEKLNKNQLDFREKLIILENSTIKLDWNKETMLIKGTPIQPSLVQLLQLAYAFCQYFSKAIVNINSCLKNMDVCNEESMKQLEECFKVDLNNQDVLNFIAITQYIGNEYLVT